MYNIEPPLRGFADILKRRLLRSVLTFQNVAVLEILSGLSNDRCPTGYKLSKPTSLYVAIACLCAHVRQRIRCYGWDNCQLLTVNCQLEYIRRGLRVVGSIRLGNATALKRGTGK